MCCGVRETNSFGQTLGNISSGQTLEKIRTKSGLKADQDQSTGERKYIDVQLRRLWKLARLNCYYCMQSRYTKTVPCVSEQGYYMLPLIQSIHKHCIYNSIYVYIQCICIFSSGWIWKKNNFSIWFNRNISSQRKCISITEQTDEQESSSYNFFLWKLSTRWKKALMRKITDRYSFYLNFQ